MLGTKSMRSTMAAASCTERRPRLDRAVEIRGDRCPGAIEGCRGAADDCDGAACAGHCLRDAGRHVTGPDDGDGGPGRLREFVTDVEAAGGAEPRASKGPAG